MTIYTGHHQKCKGAVRQSECVKVKRRIFFYDDNILHNCRDRYFKEIKGNQSIHAVVSVYRWWLQC